MEGMSRANLDYEESVTENRKVAMHELQRHGFHIRWYSVRREKPAYHAFW